MCIEVWVYADVVCDLFHPGHVEFLRQARALGDRLVVGVVGDADALTYKPAPIMSHAERIAVVGACRWVDRVLPDPCPLHCTGTFLDSIGAAFCCHGDDLTPEEVRFWYGDLVAAGRLRTVRYSHDVSTRRIIERVADRLRDGSLRVRL